MLSLASAKESIQQKSPSYLRRVIASNDCNSWDFLTAYAAALSVPDHAKA